MSKEGTRVSHALFPHFRSGKHIRSEIGTLHIVKDPRSLGSKSRFTVVVSRKIAPHSVDRNRIKRRIRGLFLTEAIPSGFIYVFYPSARVLSMPALSLKTSFTQLITQII